MQFIVLSSSRGTTFQSVIDRINDGSLTANCLGLITDRADRGCIQKANDAGLPFSIVEKIPDESREDYDNKVNSAITDLINKQPVNKLTSKQVNKSPITDTSQSQTDRPVLACMGWMWIFSPWFVHEWNNRIVNVHPALLPKYGGEGMYGHHVHDAVLASDDNESGMTIHLMDEGVDTGKTLLQKTCPIESDDTADTLQSRVQELEKEYYPKALQMIEDGSLSLE